MMLIALDKAQGCFRSPGARSIIWIFSWRIMRKLFCGQRFPPLIGRARCR